MNDKISMKKGADPSETLAWNMKLISHHELGGFGGMGEGMNMQLAADGRRILWLAHESAPKNFSGVDVSDPRDPKVVVQTELPHRGMRSNSLDVVGNTLTVAYQTTKVGDKPAGFDIFDISKPEQPKLISHFDASGPHSRGVHVLWFADGEYVHMSSGAPDFQPRSPKDDQCYRIIDIRNPSKPEEVGRWWAPGTREGDAEPSPRMKVGEFPVGYAGFRAHNTNVYPERPDRAYVGYLDYGAVILDISDKARPKVVSRWSNCPPYLGFAHTMLPLFKRNLLVMTDESVVDGAGDWPKLAWVLDARCETHPISISTLPMPSMEAFGKRGGRYGAHNLHENLPTPTSWKSDDIVIGTFFNGGVRAYDLSNPYQPQEVAYYVPGAPKMSPVGAVQLNDVFVDDRGIVFTVDRFAGGLYALEMTI
jgi:hypothetical protein